MEKTREIPYSEVVGMTPTPHCYDNQLYTENANKFGEYTDLRTYRKCSSEPEPEPDPYSRDYLTFVALSNGTFAFDQKGNGERPQYSLDNGTTWIKLEVSTNTPTVTEGSKILWKAEILPHGNDNGVGIFSSTGKFNVEGNPLSLIFGDDFEDKTDLTVIKDISGYTLKCTLFRLFLDCTKLISAENLSLPATTLADACYEYMFQNCSALEKTPKLPALTLANYCYYGIFEGCRALQEAPELPATTLAESCYGGMFKGCISLTIPPALPVTTLAGYCYGHMFEGCTALTTAPELPATTLARNCYYYMFYGCTSLTTAPELPAPILQRECYEWMFYGCKKLNYIKCLATNISASSSHYSWVNGVSSSGTFVKDASMNSWPRGASGIPNGWTIQNA